MTYGAGSLWTANYGAGTVSRVSPRQHRVIKTIPVGSQPFAVAFAAGSVWVGDFGASNVYRIDPATTDIIATIPVGPNVGAIAKAPDGSTWASD